MNVTSTFRKLLIIAAATLLVSSCIFWIRSRATRRISDFRQRIFLANLADESEVLSLSTRATILTAEPRWKFPAGTISTLSFITSNLHDLNAVIVETRSLQRIWVANMAQAKQALASADLSYVPDIGREKAAADAANIGLIQLESQFSNLTNAIISRAILLTL